MPLTITGLTARQVELLDIMWQFSELEEVEEWKSELDPATQHQVDLLLQMVVLAAYDDIMVGDTADAAKYLQKFRL